MSLSKQYSDLVEGKSLLESELEYAEIKGIPTQSLWARRKWTILNLILFVVSISLNLHLMYQYPWDSKHSILQRTSFYSPVFKSIDIGTLIKETNGTLFEPENPSPFRDAREPDASVNAAWQEYETIRVFPITREDVVKLGKDPELTVKFPEEYGLGPDAHMAQLDIFHQIHCLNLLRNLAWAEFDRNETVGKKPYSELHWIHVSHCTDIVMQNLMCSGNLDVLTFNWVETQNLPFPDFDVKHQCRNFDDIVAWQEEHSVPAEMGRNISRPAGATQIPMSEEYYKLFGYKHVPLHHDG